MNSIGANSLDISSPIRDFTQQCKEWQNYDENLHSIRVKHMRKYDRLQSLYACFIHRTNECSYDLPTDVFMPGETKPTRTKKKAPPKTTENTKPTDSATTADSTTKKRSFSNTGLGVRYCQPHGLFEAPLKHVPVR